jgi:hypothetical protein
MIMSQSGHECVPSTSKWDLDFLGIDVKEKMRLTFFHMSRSGMTLVQFHQYLPDRQGEDAVNLFFYV